MQKPFQLSYHNKTAFTQLDLTCTRKTGHLLPEHSVASLTADLIRVPCLPSWGLKIDSLPSQLLMVLPLLTVNGTEAVATATRPPETSTVTGLLVFAGIGFLCWAFYNPVKAYLSSFTKTHGPHPKGSGGDAPGKPGPGGDTGSGAPGKPSASGGDPSATGSGAGDSAGAAPGKLGPGGHEYALPPDMQEWARGVSDSFGIGQPQPYVDPHLVVRQEMPSELFWRPPLRPSFPDGTYTLDGGGSVDPLLLRQVLHILNEGLSSASLAELKLEGIRRLFYISSGIAVEIAHPGTDRYEQTIIPRELIEGWRQDRVLSGVNWYHYPQDIIPVHTTISLTTGEMIGVGLAALLIPGAGALLYRNWGRISTSFRLRVRFRFMKKLGKFEMSRDYLPVTDYEM